MKKIFLSILLSALLAANMSACTLVHEKEGNDTSNLHIDGNNNIKNNTLQHASYEKYDSVISTYRQIVALAHQPEEVTIDQYFSSFNTEERNVYEKIYTSTMLLYPRDSNGLSKNGYDQFGFTVKDLNGDGEAELILRLDNHEVIAIFMMVDGKPTLVDSYWNRKNCWIDSSGYLHVNGSSGASNSVMQIYCISDQTGELILLEEGGTAGYDEASGNTLYYKLVGNERVYLSREEYNQWVESLSYAKFDTTENLSEYLAFVPVFDKNHPAPKPSEQQDKG